MNEDQARSILRLIAVTAILIGGILTLQAGASLIAVNNSFGSAALPAGFTAQATGMLGEFGAYAVLVQALTIAAGLALYFMSPKLARHVVE